MAELALTPLHPDISGNVTAVPNTAATFRSSLNTNIGLVEDKAQSVCAAVEQLQTALGFGWLSGGAITTGTGLSVNVAALTALVGTWIGFDASQVVGGLTDAETNYIFLRQDGTWTKNITGNVPTDTATHGAYLLWGTALCAAGAVSSFTNVRKKFYATAGLYQTVTLVAADSPYTASYQRIILADSTAGSITVNLPAAATESLPYTVKKLVAGNTVTLDGNASETIDGSATLALSGAADSATIVSDGTNWHVVASHSL